MARAAPSASAAAISGSARSASPERGGGNASPSSIASPRKDYEALAAKAQEADEDFGTARLVVRARKEIAAGTRSFRKRSLTELLTAKTRCVCFANRSIEKISGCAQGSARSHHRR